MDAADDGAHAAPLPGQFVFVDLETTGANPAHHRITEVGIIRICGDALVERWSTLVNPECVIPPFIERFTGISNEMVAMAPRFSEIAATVFAKLADALFVAHNARFDYGFLRREFLRLGTHFTADVMCTVKLSRRLNPEQPRHNLDAIMQRHGLVCTARHRALGDAEVLHDLWRKLERDWPRAHLSAAAARATLGAPRLPAHLPPTLPDELPQGPGVYRYLDAQGDALFVGRSNELRERILEEMTELPQGLRARNLSAATRRVVWRETGGELGALLLEGEWRRRYAPRVGKPKQSHEDMTLRIAPDDSGRLELLPLAALADGVTTCFGVFHAERDARKAVREIARAHRLCLKVLGFEDTPGSCLAYQRQECKGACLGKEPPALHTIRLQMALTALKIKAWPFPARIGMREGNDLHVLSEWRYLGTATSEEELSELLATRHENAFDADTYRILTRYLAQRPRLEWRDLSHSIVA